MTEYKRKKRIAELKSIIQHIIARGSYYKNRKGVVLHKQSMSRIKQCKQAILNHEIKLAK